MNINEEIMMNKIIKIFSKKPINPDLVCNYSDNYYGDQKCMQARISNDKIDSVKNTNKPHN